MINSAYPYENENVCVVVHDAGAGNLLLNEIRSWSPRGLSISATGPSLHIAQSIFPEVKVTKLQESMANATLIATGTSYHCTNEHVARKFARDEGIYCIAAIDHWVNYKARFLFNEEYVLPDEILVSDPVARDLASGIFFECKVREIENSYLVNLLSDIDFWEKKIRKKDAAGLNMLYVLEPLRGEWINKFGGSPEVAAFELFHSKLLAKCKGLQRLRLRPHPSQGLEDIREVVDRIASVPNAELSLDCSLAEDIAWSDYVIGCESYALFVALNTGRQVFSSLPHGAPDLRLPFDEIYQLRFM